MNQAVQGSPFPPFPYGQILWCRPETESPLGAVNLNCCLTRINVHGLCSGLVERSIDLATQIALHRSNGHHDGDWYCDFGSTSNTFG
ncbi:hypothetical protein Rcae01_04933 [Novipirellula caenicola]|uniref:Uncharacterized protein n=1 Tax=Novipirellula caenicola TaxID=1536901 RepID=A0ABP9VWB2_9BACT